MQSYYNRGIFKMNSLIYYYLKKKISSINSFWLKNLTILNKEQLLIPEDGHVQLNRSLNFHITQCPTGNTQLKQYAIAPVT